MDNSGSFMGNAGGHGPELQEAIARRAGALNQQGAGAAGGGGALPSAAPSGGSPIAFGGATGGQKDNGRTDDAHIILKAMESRLKSQNKIAEAQHIPPKMPSGSGM